VPTVQAQIPRYYSTDNGLSSSLINQIFQDSKGFVWIATESGLNRFDSNKFHIYNNLQGDSTALPANYIRTVFESRGRKIYIGAINGLVKYKESSNSFSHVPLLGENGKPAFPHVTSLSETPEGDILVATSGQGIFLLKKDAGNAEFYSKLSDLLNSKFVSLLYRDRRQNLWIAMETGGLYCYNHNAETIQFFDSKNGLSSNYVSAITEDNNANIYIGTLTNGLNIFNIEHKTLKFIPFGKDELLIRSLHFLKNGNLLIGTDGQGLKIYFPENKTITNYNANALQLDLSNGKVHSILQDRDSNLWLGLFQKGVVFFPHTTNNFRYWGARQWRNNPIGNGCVMSIFVDNEGITWVGVDNEGIYGIDRKGQQTAHFTKTASPNSAPNIVVSITEDEQENLWIGSYTHGLAKVNKKTGYTDYIQPLAHQKVYYVTSDKDKNILAATYGAGMFIINPQTNEIKQLESSKTETNNLYTDELFNDWINTILCDSEGYIWIGHYRGLSVFSQKKNTFINFLNTNNLLPNNVVFCLHESRRDGQIWTGTTDGLFVFNKKTQKFKHFTVKDGLPNNTICGIEEDNQGNIWVSTYHGISKLNLRDMRFFNYYVSDGIQGNEFTRGAAFADAEGMLYFGGTSGVTFFEPAVIADKRGALNILLTGFYINDAIIANEKTRNAENRPVPSIMDATRFMLANHENSFSMEFSTLDYVNADRIRYQWRIEGQSNEWASTDVGNNKLVFNNLSHGNYRLRVRATDNEMLSVEKVFIIRIAPPWYLSWWAYLSYILMLTAVIFAIYKWYYSRLKYEQEILKKENEEKINESKLQFFINISHEIRTPMSLIISPLEKLISENADEKLQKTYLMIQRNAQRILRLINQLMDIRKIDKGQMKLHFRETDMVGFIDDLMLTFDYQARNKQIDFRFIHRMQKLPVYIDLNNFDKVLLNLLSNAFKFTPNGGVITIILTTDSNAEKQELKNYLQITVEDSGIGIDKVEMEKIFERFYQITNSQNQANYGTGIGLHLAKSLVELHHGEIFAENREDTRGTRFTVRLPLGKEHLQSIDFEEVKPPEAQAETPSLLKLEPMSYEEAIELDKTLRTKAKSNFKIALIEDDYEIRNYLKTELQTSFKLIESSNGKDGYNLILRELPDIVVSDIMMPEMDGITLCRKLKHNANTSHIPVVLLTAKTNMESRFEGLDMGADAYIAKPFNLDELRKTLDNLLKNRKLLKAKFSGAQDQSEKINRIEKKSADEIFLEKVMRVINDKLADPNLNVDLLANTVGYSRVHTHRKLKELTGMHAREFIRNIRMKQAANLLQNKDLTISEIAYATGFSNPSHFSNAFKEFYGTTPKKFVH
jgi:signal transduction histidine kinase/ligand-binding sensor domain-containing protein/DNA-binding response OmpR family regulator